MAKQKLNVENEAFQHYLQTQRNIIDDHDMGLREKTLDASFMMLAATGARNTSADDISEYSCSELAIYTARNLLLVNVGPLASEPNNTRKYVTWNGGILRECITTYFKVNPTISIEGFRLPKAFDAWKIERLAGIRISFTDNLADHLRLEEGDDDGEVEVLIFHHATFLKLQGQESILPNGLVDETLRTLALLFPQRQFSKTSAAHRKKRAWFEKCCRIARADYGQVVDQQLLKCGNLTASERQIEQFFFWRDRLIMLKQAYDEATPGALPQWWYDRLNGVQWYTFWIAIVVLILTVFFGLIQSIEGGIQVWKAYHPSR